MIVSCGENVYPQEVADTLMLHERIADAAVFGVPDDESGERLKAFEVAREPVSDPNSRPISVRYKIPREIVFLEELSRNPAGKMIKGALLTV